MGKTLTDKFKISKLNRGKKLGLLGAALFNLGTLMGCPGHLNPPDYNPKTIFSASSTSIKKGESTNLTFKGSNEKDDKYIIEYKIGDDKNRNSEIDSGEELTTKNSPIVDYAFTPDYSGTIKLIGQHTDTEGKIEKKNLDILVEEPDPVIPDPVDNDYVDISGRLQDCKNDGTGRSGYIVVKNKTDNSVIGTYPVNGNFSFTLPKLISELPDGIILEARLGTESNPTSYKRIIELPAGDHNPITDPRGNPAIVCKSYNPSWTTQQINDFIIHAGRRNIYSNEERKAEGIDGFVNGNSKHGLKKWNLGELPDTEGHPIFRGIKISNQLEDYLTLKEEIESEGINVVIENNPTSESGWGIILPAKPDDGAGTLLYDQKGVAGVDGYIERFEVYLNTTDKKIRRHEWEAHGIDASSGHSNGRDNNPVGLFLDENGNSNSYGNANSPYPDGAQESDKELKEIVRQPTYLGMEGIEDILRL